MKLDGGLLAVFVVVLGALIQGAYGIQITASGGGNGESSSASMNFGTLKDTTVSSQMAINGAYLTPTTTLVGPVPTFGETHSFTDKSGKIVTVSANVINSASGMTYKSQILPVGAVSSQIYPSVSAEQWLNVPKADSIKCTVASSYGTARSASVGLEEYKNPLVATDFVTLTGYYGKAVNTGTSVLAVQTATSGAANSIKIYGSAKDSSGAYSAYTQLNSFAGRNAVFTGLGETASAGSTAYVAQREHLIGSFASTAACKPTTSTAKTTTRTSNYGTLYDLYMNAVKGSTPTGTVGYYVNPATSANKIQGAVDAAQSKDTINVAAGTYKRISTLINL